MFYFDGEDAPEVVESAAPDAEATEEVSDAEVAEEAAPEAAE